MLRAALATLGVVIVGAILGFTAPDPLTTDTPLPDVATACGHVGETLVLLDANHDYLTSPEDETSAEVITEMLVATFCGSCCPTYNADYDCWSSGHWHYNHCKTCQGFQ